MQQELRGKAALVTGGTRGIGLAVVRRFLEHGASVFTCARHCGPQEESLRSLQATHAGRLHWMAADIGRTQDVERAIAAAGEAFGGLDILVNNAAGVESGKLETLTDAQWQCEFDSKLMAMVRTARMAIPLMRARGGGAIVNVNATFAKQPHPDFFASSVIRASCLALTKLIAREHAREGIRANAVGLGVVATDAWRAWHDPAAGSYDAFLRSAAVAYDVPLGRMATPDEIADAVLYLAGPRSTYVSGTQLDVDGGLARYL